MFGERCAKWMNKDASKPVSTYFSCNLHTTNRSVYVFKASQISANATLGESSPVQG